jgi:NADP-reducing hydrogenase subunit HndB
MTNVKSLEDLKRLRDEALEKRKVKSASGQAQVIVAMGTCGIAAGARDVVAELVSELDKSGVHTVTVRQSGCIGLCDQEPMLTYTDKAGNNYLYVKLTKPKVREFVERHLLKGEPVEQYILSGEAT